MGRNGRAACAGASIAFLLAVPAAPQRVVTWSDVAAARLPHPRELETEALLAEAAAAAAGAGGRLLEGPTASFSSGPRRADGEDTEADVAVEVEMPLLAERRRRLDLTTGLHGKREAIRAAAEATALADLAAAYARAWLAQVDLELRRQDLAITEAWLESTRRRVEAGADPPYEAILIAGERDRALLGLLDARRESELAWGELGQLADIPPAPSPLDLSSLPDDGALPSGTRIAIGEPPPPAAAGIASRRELAILLARARSSAASSRWALAADAGREGDEQVARVGLAYRFALQGERAAVASARSAAEAAAHAEATAELGRLRARVAAAQAALASTAPSFDAGDLDTARRALESRLEEGKERASQVLPLRRQLLEAMLATAGARAARAQAAAELFFLEGGRLP
jgi:hypothetical protein